MSEAQAERAVQVIYEDPNLREDLADEQADFLLKWGEDQTMKLSERGLEDDQFDGLFTNLRVLMAQINRYIGKRDSMPPDARRATLGEIGKLARLLDFKAGDGELTAFDTRQASLPPDEALRALTELIQPSAEPAEPPPPIDIKPAAAPSLADALKKGLSSYDTPNKRQQSEE